MDCHRANAIAIVSVALVAFAVVSSSAVAQRTGSARRAFNPVTGQTELDTRYHKPLPSPSYRSDDVQYFPPGDHVAQASYCEECGTPECGGCSPGFEHAGGCDDGCCDTGCCGDVMCCDPVCGDCVGCGPCMPGGCWYAGFEATFVKPHFGENVAFTVTDNTANSSTIGQSDFNYDLEMTPRVFVGWNRGRDVGLRATWWHFDHGAQTASGSPPASGLGELTPPSFADVDLSTSTPTDVFTANTSLNAYAIDLEATKASRFCDWQLGMGWGFRYAYVEQGYLGALTNGDSQTVGTIDYKQSIEGFGPTVSVEAFRPYGCRSGLFCKARGSILFGDSKSRLAAEEDLNLTTPFETTSTTASDDVLSIGELQVGYRWHAARSHCYAWQPFYSIALEGQIWDGAGNASSQDGRLGFFGFNTAMGVNW